MRHVFLTLLLLAGCTSRSPQQPQIGEQAPARWWRGNLHTHSFWSDGDSFPELVLRDYRDAGYHFVALTEHNNVAGHFLERSLEEISARSCGEAYDDYVDRWLSGDSTDPGLGDPIRIRTISSIARELNETSRFLVLPGEEISASAAGMRVHVTTIDPHAVVRPLNSEAVPTAIRENLAAARADNPEALLILNHPNHDYAITAEDMVQIEEIEFVEIFSGHRGVRMLGDGNHPPVERLWDVANTLRIAQAGLPPIYGIANDDAHDYYCDLDARPNRGWVQVRARSLDSASLFAAMRAGDFYCSSGVELAVLEYDPQTRTLKVEVQPEDGVDHVIEFIGTRAGFDPAHTPRVASEGFTRISDSYSADIGQVLSRVEGSSASYTLAEEDLYVRAVVSSTQVLDSTQNVYRWQVAQAWTQPVGWETRVTR